MKEFRKPRRSGFTRVGVTLGGNSGCHVLWKRGGLYIDVVEKKVFNFFHISVTNALSLSYINDQRELIFYRLVHYSRN